MNELINLLSSMLALLGLWIAFDVGYRAYRMNVFRDRLFELRSELFEAARSGLFGENGFSDPVYCRTRRVLNGAVRFAHHMTLSRMLVLHWSSRWWLDQRLIRDRNRRLKRGMRSLNPQARGIVIRTMREADFAVVTHMLHVHPIGFVVMTVLKVVGYCYPARQRDRAIVAKRISRNRSMLEPLEEEALRGLDCLEHKLAA